jgi:DNA-binding response OmpR family regulator
LIVEDDADVAEALSLILYDAGYDAEIARNGSEGLERLRSGAPPSLILLDLMMPIMDGFEFRRQQLSTNAFAKVPVVVVTADGDGARKAAEMGIDCLMKPIDIDALLASVSRARAGSGSPSAASGDRSQAH